MVGPCGDAFGWEGLDDRLHPFLETHAAHVETSDDPVLPNPVPPVEGTPDPGTPATALGATDDGPLPGLSPPAPRRW